MKKIVLFMCLLVFLLCSCGKNDELGKNSIVSVIYADYTEDGYVFYSQATDFSDKEQKKDTLHSAKGKTPDEAWLNLNANFPETPYFGHLNAIVLGEGFFNKNTEETLKFFLSLNPISPNAQVYITKLSPYEFDLKSLAQMTSNKLFPQISLYSFFLPSNYLCDIPVIEGSQKEPFCRSTAITEGFSHIKTLDDDNFFVYSLLKNRDYTKYYKSFELESTASRMKVKDSKLHVSLKILPKTVVPVEKDVIRKSFKDSTENFIRFLIKNDMTHILTNEKFEDYELKINILTKETSKMR